MNAFLDNKFSVREKRLKRNYEIENDLYSKLEEFSQYYNASVSDIVNICINALVSQEKIELYEKVDENSTTHTLFINVSNIDAMDNIKQKYGLSISKLINMSIRRILNE